jgi:hypothetical protein
MVYEPAGSSGVSRIGGHASFDRVTRAMAVYAASPPWLTSSES